MGIHGDRSSGGGGMNWGCGGVQSLNVVLMISRFEVPMWWMFWRLYGYFRILRLRMEGHSWGPCDRCPCCGYQFEMGNAGFTVEGGGAQPGSVDSPIVYWAHGTQTCPRCRFEFPYEDSSA